MEFTFVTMGCKIVHRTRPIKADPADPETLNSDALDSIQLAHILMVDNGGQLSAKNNNVMVTLIYPLMNVPVLQWSSVRQSTKLLEKTGEMFGMLSKLSRESPTSEM